MIKVTSERTSPYFAWPICFLVVSSESHDDARSSSQPVEYPHRKVEELNQTADIARNDEDQS
jgi:hypothetical protein